MGQFAVCSPVTSGVKHIPMTPSMRVVNPSPVEIIRTYINNTDRPVSVAERTGLKYIINPARSFEEPLFKIRYEFRFKEEIKNHIVHVLSVVEDDSPEVMRALREAMESVMSANRPAYDGFYSFVLDFPVRIETIEDYGGTIYVSDCDLVLSVEALDSIIHPYSAKGCEERLTADIVSSSSMASFIYALTVVDNEGVYGTLYTAIKSDIHRVTPVRDFNRRSGIYITTSKPVVNELGKTEMKTRRFELCETTLASFGIFSSISDAKARGDKDAARKEELVNAEHSLALSKQETLVLKDKIEKAMAARAEMEKEREHERQKHLSEMATLRDKLEHVNAIERMKAKDAYEDRSTSRKDSSEMLKYIPAVIVGAGAIFAAWAGWFK